MTSPATGSRRALGDADPARQRVDQSGFTLPDVMVSLAVLSVVMIIFTAGILRLSALYRVTSAMGEAQSQVGRAFVRLDNELRYAADLRVLDESTSLAYVITANGATCHLLTLVDDRLLRQRWAPHTERGPAEILASGVGAIDDAPGGEKPFTIVGGAPPGATEDDGGLPAEIEPKSAVVALKTSAGDRELRAEFLAPNTLRGPQEVSLDDCLS